jgi:acyl-coenzyme A thioesterase PaaI-like protein
MAGMGAVLASEWTRGAGIGMNVVHLKEVPHGNKVMVKAVPLRIGKRIQVWEKEDTTTLSFVACFMKICISLDDLGCTLFARLSAPAYY